MKFWSSPFTFERRQLHNHHFFQKCCYFLWFCFDSKENDNTFETRKNKENLSGAQKTLIPKGSACCCHRCPKNCSFKLYFACTYGQKQYFFYFNLLFQFLFSGKYCGDKFPPIITSSGFGFCVSNFLSILSYFLS